MTMSSAMRKWSVPLAIGVIAAMWSLRIDAKPLDAAATSAVVRDNPGLVTPFVFTGGCSVCAACQYHTTITGHSAFTGTDMGGGHSWCSLLQDCNGHPGCTGAEGEPEMDGECGEEEPDCDYEPEEEELLTASAKVPVAEQRATMANKLANKALAGDEEAARVLLSEYGDIAHLDAKAKAIWIAECVSTNISALVPVSAAFVSSVLAERQ